MPKSASRSLKVLGLLGELDTVPHSSITAYPQFYKYDWHVVVRDEDVWMASWWRQCCSAKDLFAISCGMRFVDMGEDLQRLSNARNVRYVTTAAGVNSWIPRTVKEDFARCLATGKSFYGYCFDVITAGIPCTTVKMSSLDLWLIERGYSPAWENRDEFGDQG